MSDARRELILDELGLLPLWTRRELLAERQAETASETLAEPILAIAPTPAARPAPLVKAHPAPPPPVAAEPVQPALVAPENNARAAAIAAMDWQALQAGVASCTACGLCQSRNRTVFGVGNPGADWLVVGEAPGAEEDRQGEPFVGQAGRLLDSMLEAVDRNRKENVFILNTLKCRPPQNRNPTPEEIALCAPFLHRQVELIKPKVIFAVGRFAVQSLLNREATIASLRGKTHDYRGIPVIVSYHPAYLLRNMPDKSKAWQDLVLAKKTLAAAV
ncbi:uracil-DNA glycosylase [Chitinimonas arctica]|uniref:Type-4 uracil-DNA glycosylase n=1 Tax=Chitinimonas arctica TaxID=2594795 RepID=A0A516SIT1_9NEIS|nr:uracil-DNA glycosylase [Chitinimonas arctica]QDQ28051.1 uracil-DNA glycosylase [Chitinimonas arctica]